MIWASICRISNNSPLTVALSSDLAGEISAGGSLTGGSRGVLIEKTAGFGFGFGRAAPPSPQVDSASNRDPTPAPGPGVGANSGFGTGGIVWDPPMVTRRRSPSSPAGAAEAPGGEKPSPGAPEEKREIFYGPPENPFRSPSPL